MFFILARSQLMTIKNNAKFISIEGIEGGGKTTALKFINGWVEGHKLSHVVTRQPGGTPIAEAIRNVLLGHYEEMMSPDTELLLMFAGRAQNISHVILPALRRGQWVVSDRFTDASFAYQGGGRGVSKKHIDELASWVQGDLRVDVTFLLDVPSELGISRVESRGARDRIESEGHEFFNRVRETYLKLAKQHPERFCVIDSTQDLKTVQIAIESRLNTLLL